MPLRTRLPQSRSARRRPARPRARSSCSRAPARGKTRVLTHRIAHLVHERGVSPAPDPRHHLHQQGRERDAGAPRRARRSRCALHVGDDVPRDVRAHASRPTQSVSASRASFIDLRRRRSQAHAQDVLMAELDLDEKRYPAQRRRVSHLLRRRTSSSALRSSNRRAVTPIDKACGQRLHARTRRACARPTPWTSTTCSSTAHRLLAEHEDVLRAYQDRFRYVTVDEYQDTNHAQYRIVRSAASRGHRNLMVVGDDDQSIYSWRGADIRNILEFEHDYPDATVVSSRRTTAPRDASWPRRTPSSRTTRVASPRRSGRRTPRASRSAAYYASDERDEARFVVAEIERLRRAEDARYSDIAVFYRTQRAVALVEDRFLRRRGALPDRRAVPASSIAPRSRDVMAYLRLIVNPADEISLRRIINTPRRGIGKTTIERVEFEARTRGMPFEQALDPRCRGLAGVALADERTGIPGAPPRAQSARGGLAARPRRGSRRAVGSHPRRSRRSARMRPCRVRTEHSEFFGVVEEYSAAHEGADLPDFMEWVALATDLDTLGEGGDDVTLMTVHTAKGLEYPVVFVVGMEEAIFPHANSMFDPDGARGGAAARLRRHHTSARTSVPDLRSRAIAVRPDAAQPAEPLHRRDSR